LATLSGLRNVLTIPAIKNPTSKAGAESVKNSQNVEGKSLRFINKVYHAVALGD